MPTWCHATLLKTLVDFNLHFEMLQCFSAGARNFTSAYFVFFCATPNLLWHRLGIGSLVLLKLAFFLDAKTLPSCTGVQREGVASFDRQKWITQKCPLDRHNSMTTTVVGQLTVLKNFLCIWFEGIPQIFSVKWRRPMQSINEAGLDDTNFVIYKFYCTNL